MAFFDPPMSDKLGTHGGGVCKEASSYRSIKLSVIYHPVIHMVPTHDIQTPRGGGPSSISYPFEMEGSGGEIAIFSNTPRTLSRINRVFPALSQSNRYSQIVIRFSTEITLQGGPSNCHLGRIVC